VERKRSLLKNVAQRLLSCRLSPRVDASDIVQEAMVDAARAPSQFVALNDQEIFARLARIVRCRGLDACRRHLRSSRRSMLRERRGARPSADRSWCALTEILIGDSSSPDEKVSRKEQLEQLGQAIHSLSTLDRELLELRDLGQLQVAEVAERLHITPTAVTTRHLRALRRLRRQLNVDRSPPVAAGREHP
jgi:RNA polymerase sigma-70 factor (ECF subfamily)